MFLGDHLYWWQVWDVDYGFFTLKNNKNIAKNTNIRDRNKSFWIFFELCSILQTYRNRLRQTIFRNSTGNTLLLVYPSSFQLELQMTYYDLKSRTFSNFQENTNSCISNPEDLCQFIDLQINQSHFWTISDQLCISFGPLRLTISSLHFRGIVESQESSPFWTDRLELNRLSLVIHQLQSINFMSYSI